MLKVDYDALVQAVEAFVGKTVLIHESLSRSRDVGGHNRHFATYTRFTMRLKAYGISISGQQLSLEGEDGSLYGISMTNITSVTFCAAEETLEIIEQFETEMERQTTLSKPRVQEAAEPGAAPDAKAAFFVAG
jgi:hypothetical protein